MNPQRKRRLLFIGLLIAGTGTAAGLALYAFNQNMMYYYKPAEVVSGEAPANTTIRVGGLVVSGSVHKEDESTDVSFVITDLHSNIRVQYKGILPDLFREGQGVVVRGRLNKEGIFVAEEVLAKHDEKYMPPEVADSLSENANGTRPQ